MTHVTNHDQESPDFIRSMPVPTCFLCGSKGTPLYNNLKDRLFQSPGTWNLKACPKPECGLIWLDPMPTKEDIHKAYSNYFTHQFNADINPHLCIGYTLRRKCRLVLASVYRHLMGTTSLPQEQFHRGLMYLSNNKPARLLDIGCGNGSFLDQMQSRGWEVRGTEVDSKAAALARERFGIPVDVGTLEEAHYPNAYFDVITLNHVIEHLHNPIGMLKECHRLLKSGGWLVVVTPNTTSMGHARFGPYWRALEPPRHLSLFSPLTLRCVAQRAGFQKIDTWTTTANAQGISQASLDIQRYGKHVMGSKPPLLHALKSRWFQAREMARHRNNPNAGEEVVLRAYK